MDFEQELASLWDAAAAEGRAAKANAQAFDESWERVRTETVAPALQAAAKVIRDKLTMRGRGVPAEVKRENGATVLIVAWSVHTQQPQFKLSLSKDAAAQMIDITSTHDAAWKEAFTLENLTAEVLRLKLREFIAAVARELG